MHVENQAVGKTTSCNVKDIVHEPPIEFWNIDTQFGRAEKFIIHPASLPAIRLNNSNEQCDACTFSPVNNLHPPYSASFQYIPHWNIHQCNALTEVLRIHTVSFITAGLPHPPLMDHHHPHSIRRFE